MCFFRKNTFKRLEKKISLNITSKQQKHPFVVVLLFFFVFLNFSFANAQQNSPNLDPQKSNAIIYVSEGTAISGVEQITGAEIVYLKKAPKVEKQSVKKNPKTNKEKVKMIDEPKKKVRQYKKIVQDKVINYPYSSEGSDFFSISKNTNIVVLTNEHYISKFIDISEYSLLTKEKFAYKKIIFGNFQKKDLFNFSEVFNVRPPPFI